MYNGAEHIEFVNAYRQQLDHQIDRAAREIEVERLLAPANPNLGAELGKLHLGGIIAAIAGWFRPRRLHPQPGD
jgi:hypothetical protein